MIQAMPKRIAAMMASMPCCFPWGAVITGPAGPLGHNSYWEA